MLRLGAEIFDPYFDYSLHDLNRPSHVAVIFLRRKRSSMSSHSLQTSKPEEKGPERCGELALGELFENRQGVLWSFVRARVGVRDAEDVFQNVAVKLCNFLLSHPGVDFRLLAFKIARDEVTDYYRSKKRQPQAEPLDYLLENNLAPPNSDAEKGGLDDRLAQMKNAGLSQEQRTTVVLRYYVGYTVKEIAVIMEVPEETVRSRLRLAKLKMAHGLKKEGQV